MAVAVEEVGEAFPVGLPRHLLQPGAVLQGDEEGSLLLLPHLGQGQGQGRLAAPPHGGIDAYDPPSPGDGHGLLPLRPLVAGHHLPHQAVRILVLVHRRESGRIRPPLLPQVDDLPCPDLLQLLLGHLPAGQQDLHAVLPRVLLQPLRRGEGHRPEGDSPPLVGKIRQPLRVQGVGIPHRHNFSHAFSSPPA